MVKVAVHDPATAAAPKTELDHQLISRSPKNLLASLRINGAGAQQVGPASQSTEGSVQWEWNVLPGTEEKLKLVVTLFDSDVSSSPLRLPPFEREINLAGDPWYLDVWNAVIPNDLLDSLIKGFFGAVIGLLVTSAIKPRLDKILKSLKL